MSISGGDRYKLGIPKKDYLLSIGKECLRLPNFTVSSIFKPVFPILKKRDYMHMFPWIYPYLLKIYIPFADYFIRVFRLSLWVLKLFMKM